MKQVVIMPGGFHPFHAGHYALYQQAQDAFPGADVYVAATNDTSSRPFPFAVKEKLAKLAGVKPGHFVQVKSPFQAREITANLDPENTQLIFVRSEKDANKPPQAGGVKKDGNPAYLQPLEGQGELAPMNRHAYMAYLPTVEFGPGMTSATEIRTAWPRLNEKRKTALVMSLYPKTQSNPALAANVVKLLDTAIGGEELNEGSGSEYILYINNKPAAKYTDIKQAEQDLVLIKSKVPSAKFEIKQEVCNMVAVPTGLKEALLKEFAPDEGGGSRKFIPWPEFIEQVKQIVAKDFDCVENVVKTTIKARFVPHDPMEYGPTMLYSYYETRAGGRNKGAVSTRGSIQVGKYTGGGFTGQIEGKLLTTFSLLKGHPFERHFDLTFDNIYKIANIIQGNTEGALEFKPEGVAEAVDIGQEWMSDTELDQYVPDHLQQQWRELLGYDRNGNPSALWANLTGGYEPDVRDPQHRSLMVKVANKWFAAKKIPNVTFFNVRDADDELEWLVQIGPHSVAEGQTGPVEAYGYVYDRRDQRVMWRKTFPSAEAAYAWADSKNATVLGTRSVEQTVDEDYVDEKK